MAAISSTLIEIVDASFDAAVGSLRTGVIVFGSASELQIQLRLGDRVNSSKRSVKNELKNILTNLTPMSDSNGTAALERVVDMFHDSPCYRATALLVSNGAGIRFEEVDNLDVKIVTPNTYQCKKPNNEDCWNFNESAYLDSKPKLHLQIPGHMSFLQDSIIYDMENCHFTCKEKASEISLVSC